MEAIRTYTVCVVINQSWEGNFKNLFCSNLLWDSYYGGPLLRLVLQQSRND